VERGHRARKKALASLAMLVSWEQWIERNARVFNNKFSTASMFIAKFKVEVALWSLVGTKRLSNIMTRE
jgi:hypothetical protein